MSNKNTIYVPVDPQAYGLGIALGCLIRFWPIWASLLALLVCVMLGAGILGSITESAAREERNKAAATQAVQYTSTLSASIQRANSGLAVLQNYRGVLNISKTDTSEQGQVTISKVEFTSDGILVYLDAVLAHQNVNKPDHSCVSVLSDGYYYILPTRSDFKQLGDAPFHYVGAAFYPRFCNRDTCDGNLPYSNKDNKYLDFWLIPPKLDVLTQTYNQTATTVNFKYGCSAFFHSIKLFDFGDFASP